MFINETARPYIVELEPTFLKALKLLHSRSETSAAELRQIYEDTLKKNRKENKKIDADESSIKNKLQFHSSEVQDFSTSEKTDTKTSKETETSRKRMVQSSDDDTDVSDDDDDAVIQATTTPLDSDTMICVVCKSLSQFSQNQLVECQECHGLYHQECHKPPITENINDPRLVWYCAKCSRTLSKKIASKPPAKKVKLPTTQASLSASASTSSSRDSPLLFSKAISSSSLRQDQLTSSSSSSFSSSLMTQQPFKRIESNKAKDANASTSSSSRGLACLAANLASSNKTKSKPPSSLFLSSSSSNSSSSSSSFKTTKTSKPSVTSFSSAISGQLSFASSLNRKN